MRGAKKAGTTPGLFVSVDWCLLAQRGGPGAVEIAAAALDLEAMGAEEVALALGEIGRALGLTVAVEIAERRREAESSESPMAAAATTLRRLGWLSFMIETKSGPRAG